MSTYVCHCGGQLVCLDGSSYQCKDCKDIGVPLLLMVNPIGYERYANLFEMLKGVGSGKVTVTMRKGVPTSAEQITRFQEL